ncbi:MAG: sulfatase-like hydrolase/transferase [Anaerohalosphaera sp.]|nr:sulfatase-like hydrolase/transferase [Anaerohalosphaera sp.]
MERRTFIKLAALTAIPAVTSCSLNAQTQKSAKPNIILIMADDIGTECFKLYGGTSYKTPHLDHLAKTGIHFTNCHSQPLCTPTRVKIMTGQSNIRNYSDFSILEPDQRTFGHIFQQHGYKTAVAGKWQLLAAEHYGKIAGTGTHPKDAGFDEYCLWQVDKLGSRYWQPKMNINGKTTEFPKDKYGPDVSCDFINRFIEKHKEVPFMVYFPMALVHDPFVPTPDSKDKNSRNKQLNFADMVAYMDKIVARITAKLDELNLRNNTLIIFTGDNGTHKTIKSQTTAGTIQGAKGQTIDTGTHVPLIANFPGTIPPNRKCEDLIDFTDFLPTMADLAKIKLPTDRPLDGQTFAPQLLGKKGKPRQAIFCYYNPRPTRQNFEEKCFARDKTFKLYKKGNLYNVIEDPLEKSPINNNTTNKQAIAARKKLQKTINKMPQKPARIPKKV